MHLVDETGTSRRAVLSAVAGGVGGVVGLAGCSSRRDDGSSGGPPTLPTEPNYGGWFNNVSNYRRTVDRRDQSETTVTVGSRANGGNLGFEPPAVAVSPGTTVTWDWNGEGGAHNVVAENGTFDSGQPVRPASTSHEHTFEAPGVLKYVCEPHATLGMKGAVFVAIE